MFFALQGLEFSSHCLDKNLPHMFYLWAEIFARFVLLIQAFFLSVSICVVGRSKEYLILSKIYCRPTLNDTERLRTLINMLASDLAMSVSHSGHLYAMALAASSLSPAARLSEQFGGLSQVFITYTP